jgi:hypothetical protein
MALIDVYKKSSILGPIIVIALSIVAVVTLYVIIGHIGPTFSSDVVTRQRGKLRQHYRLPPEPVIANLKTLQIPPSESSLPPSVYYGSSK